MSDLVKRGGELSALLEKMRPAIAQALPKHISPDRIARIALTAIRSNPKLAECSPQSFLGSLLQASQLGLEVNTPLGQAYLIPYGNVCTLVVGYQGMMDLGRRSGMVKAIYAHAVRENDEFNYELGLEPKLKHIPAEGDRGKLTHVYAVARLTDGEPIFTVLTVAEVELYRSRSRAANNGPWVTDYEAMALKTAVRRIFKWLPKSAEMALAASLDEADDTARHPSEAFSPEITNILGAGSDEPAPSPAPEGTPDGRRVSMRTQKPNGARPPSEPPAAQEQQREPGEEG
jgi:recombination protein RecT